MTALSKSEIEPGFYPDIPEDDYHHGAGISKSGLDLVNKSARHYHVGKYNPKPPTPAMVFGSALHCLVLEPERFERDYIAEPTEAPKKPTAAQRNAKKPSAAAVESIEYWDKFEAQADGKTIISTKPGDGDAFWSPSDWDRLHSMAATIYEHPVAHQLIELPGRAELSYYWNDQDTGLLCRSRGDYVTDCDMIIDLKTCIDASLSGFTRAVGNFRYHVANAFYSDGYETLKCRPQAFVFMAVEKTPPYNVALYVLDGDAVHSGRIAYQNDLRTFKACSEANDWPGYCSDTASPFTPRVIDLPPWAKRGNES